MWYLAWASCPCPPWSSGRGRSGPPASYHRNINDSALTGVDEICPIANAQSWGGSFSQKIESANPAQLSLAD